jgi:hypothetical protein
VLPIIPQGNMALSISEGKQATNFTNYHQLTIILGKLVAHLAQFPFHLVETKMPDYSPGKLTAYITTE